MKLTKLVKSAGCAAKLGPKELALALKSLPTLDIPEVLVGYENSDDAGIYALTDELALVQTVDYFPPIVDDPYDFGQIAAANALSDVYAMGGMPRTALSIVGFPSKGLEFSILGDIMRGGLDKLREAGVALVGGHSIKDEEIKFGYAITGTIRPIDVRQNRGARPGDRVFLTKALGTGLITTALKNDAASPEHVAGAVRSMAQLNREASAIALAHDVNTMTDVTGFGLVGHALEVARASGLSIRIEHERLPVLPGALEYSRRGYCSSGLQSNLEFCSSEVEVGTIREEYRNLLFDPQTSGGLLVFCKSEKAEAFRAALDKASICSIEIGCTESAGAGAPIRII